MSINLYIFSVTILTSLIFISYIIGDNFLKLLKIEEKYLSIITGYSIIVIATTTLFFFDIEIYFIRYIIFSLFILCLLKFLSNKNLFFFNILQNQILIYIFFLLTIILYGEQFYIFRGNHFDSLNYTAMSLLSSNFSYSEIQNINFFHNSHFYERFSKVFLHDRPTISILISLVYLPKITDLFLVNYIFKIFFLILAQQSFCYFLTKIYNRISKLKIFFLSNFFVFSFFLLYIFEIDSYSQLGVFGISVSFICFSIFCDIKNLDNRKIIFFSTISSAFFLIYPEQAILYFILIIFYFSYKNYKIFFNKIIIFIPIFLIMTLPSFQIYKFLLNQLIFSKDFSGDWWGYFGAFVLGSQNIVLEDYYVDLIKSSVNKMNKIENLKFIYNLNSEQYGKFFFINFIPALAGVYYIDVLKNYNLFLYFFICITLNFVIIYFIIKNIKILFKSDSNFISFFKFFICFFTFVGTFLIFFSNFWILIKFYFYFSFLIFILILISFKLENKKEKLFKKYNILLIIFNIILPFYKYSIFNHGIGMYDSMPSILNKSYKINYGLTIPQNMIRYCEKLYVIRKNKILDDYVTAKLLFYKKNFEFTENIKNKSKCKI